MSLSKVETYNEGMAKKEYFLKLLEDAKLPKIKGALAYWHSTSGELCGACAYGLGMIACGMTEDRYHDSEYKSTFHLTFHYDIWFKGNKYHNIIALNDRTELTFHEIAKVLRDNLDKWHIGHFTEFLDQRS